MAQSFHEKPGENGSEFSWKPMKSGSRFSWKPREKWLIHRATGMRNKLEIFPSSPTDSQRINPRSWAAVSALAAEVLLRKALNLGIVELQNWFRAQIYTWPAPPQPAERNEKFPQGSVPEKQSLPTPKEANMSKSFSDSSEKYILQLFHLWLFTWSNPRQEKCRSGFFFFSFYFSGMEGFNSVLILGCRIRVPGQCWIDTAQSHHTQFRDLQALSQE